MKQEMSESERKLRSEFDFSRAVRGKYHERFKKGYRVHFLSEDPGDHDPLDTCTDPDQDVSTREMGRQFFESQLRAAGLKWEPLEHDGFDYVIYRPQGENGIQDGCPVRLATSASEGFSLYRKNAGVPRLLNVYVWRSRTPGDASVYALTYQEALKIVEKKGYVRTHSWNELGGYSVTHAGAELKALLAPYRMTPERWDSKLITL